MATKTKYNFGVTHVSKGGRKGKEWTVCFTPGDGSLLVAQAAQRSAARKFAARAAAAQDPKPRGASSTVVQNPANPAAAIIADDCAIRIGGIPISTPTVGSGYFTAITLGTVIATTGPLAAGVYRLEVTMGYAGVFAAGKEMRCEQRNATDTGLIHTFGLCAAGVSTHFVLERVVIAANERVRIISGAVAAGAGETVEGQLRAYLLPL